MGCETSKLVWETAWIFIFPYNLIARGQVICRPSACALGTPESCRNPVSSGHLNLLTEQVLNR